MQEAQQGIVYIDEGDKITKKVSMHQDNDKRFASILIVE